ncbi:hypothetical protein NT05HA_1463 [Aggregatibacter aphrophilus NJ8700]|nr:hypothetical protein NT05HA_1463 [Aggregatibacter aphrophilus NJ8700]
MLKNKMHKIWQEYFGAQRKRSEISPHFCGILIAKIKFS